MQWTKSIKMPRYYAYINVTSNNHTTVISTTALLLHSVTFAIACVLSVNTFDGWSNFLLAPPINTYTVQSVIRLLPHLVESYNPPLNATHSLTLHTHHNSRLFLSTLRQIQSAINWLRRLVGIKPLTNLK